MWFESHLLIIFSSYDWFTQFLFVLTAVWPFIFTTYYSNPAEVTLQSSGLHEVPRVQLCNRHHITWGKGKHGCVLSSSQMELTALFRVPPGNEWIRVKHVSNCTDFVYLESWRALLHLPLAKCNPHVQRLNELFLDMWSNVALWCDTELHRWPISYVCVIWE